MADKITFNDKSHVIPYGTREIQIWDLDINEIKAVVNDNADVLEGLENNQVDGVLRYDTLAELEAIASPSETSSYRVTQDGINNGYYSYNGTSFVLDEFQPITSEDTTDTVTENSTDLITSGGVYEDNITQFQNYPAFVQYGDTSTLGDDFYDDKLRGQQYQAIKSIKLYGFDETQDNTITSLWNSASTTYFRLIIKYWDGSGYVDVFDSENQLMDDLGLTSDSVGNIDITVGEQRVVAEIDFNLVPYNLTVNINSASKPECVFKNECYDEGIVNDLQIQSIKNLNLYDDSISMTDNINTVSGYETSRTDIYRAFNKLELYGFNKENPHKISNLWINKNGTQYRLIIQELVDGSWTTVYDFNSATSDGYEVVVIENSVWKLKFGGLDAEIDLRYLPEQMDGTLEGTEPSYIIADTCFNEAILKVNSARPYYTSRRKPTICITSDDLLDSDINVFNVAKEYGFDTSFAIQTNYLNSEVAGRYIDFYNKGATILASSINSDPMSNPANITYSEVDNNMKISKELIEAYGMKVSGWVTPSSVLDISFFPLMEKNFGYGFTSLNSGLYDATVDPLKMGRYSIEQNINDDTHDITAITDRIDTAIANNELLVLYTHGLPSQYSTDIHGQPAVNIDDMRNIYDYLKSKTDDNLCQVLSLDEAVFQYYKTPFA